MESIITEKYMNKIKNMNDAEYLFGIISYGIAPTLSGNKPSSIITLGKNNADLNILWEKYKYIFLEKYNLNFFELKKNQNSVTILFYYSDKLKSAIYSKKHMKFLNKFGYSEKFDLYKNMYILKERFKEACPHEVGVFLGFPLDDVICFMEKPSKRCLMCGYWKVYNDLDLAREIFADYDKARYNVAQNVIQGVIPSMLIDILENVAYV